MAIVWPDSYQQDGGTHFLFARDAWWNHTLLVDVWGRPLFTTLYAIPARAGYLPAKLFTVSICVVTAWQCWRWAADEGLARPELAIPFLALQPSMVLLTSETMTEPLFALVLVIALRLRRNGRSGAALIVASLLPLARPEGFFICLLWGVWSIGDLHLGNAWWRRLRALPLLLTGVLAWWLAALSSRRIHSSFCTTGRAIGRRLGRNTALRHGSITGDSATTSSRKVRVAVRGRLHRAHGAAKARHGHVTRDGAVRSSQHPSPLRNVRVGRLSAVLRVRRARDRADHARGVERGRGRVPPRAGSRHAAHPRAASGALCTRLRSGMFLIAARNDLYFVDDHDSSRDARAVADADDWLRAHSISENTCSCGVRRTCASSGGAIRDTACRSRATNRAMSRYSKKRRQGRSSSGMERPVRIGTACTRRTSEGGLHRAVRQAIRAQAALSAAPVVRERVDTITGNDALLQVPGRAAVIELSRSRSELTRGRRRFSRKSLHRERLRIEEIRHAVGAARSSLTSSSPRSLTIHVLRWPGADRSV